MTESSIWKTAATQGINFTCVSGDCVNGYGIGISNNGGYEVRYQIEGYFKNGKLNGPATYKNANGAYYAALYDNGEKGATLAKNDDGLVRLSGAENLSLAAIKRYQTLAFAKFKPCDCLIKTVAERRFTYGVKKEIVDERGNVDIRYDPEEGSTEVDAWQNKCNTTVFLKGLHNNYSWSRDKTEYSDISTSVAPDQFIEYVDISPAFNNTFGHRQYLGQYVANNVTAVKTSGTTNIDNSTDDNIAQKVGDYIEVTSYTNATNITVKKGDHISIIATGAIVLGSFSGSSGPDGIQWSRLWTYKSDVNYGALMARVGDVAPWILVGSKGTIIAQQSGRLNLIVNDTDPSDNDGSYKVKVSVSKK